MFVLTNLNNVSSETHTLIILQSGTSGTIMTEFMTKYHSYLVFKGFTRSLAAEMKQCHNFCTCLH